MTPQQEAFTGGSGLQAYRRLAVGEQGWLSLAYYELSGLLALNLPGLPGYALRSILFPPQFAGCGARPAFGRSLVIRNPAAIRLGRKNLIDDFAVLDARSGASISLGDYVSIGRYSILAAKSGHIKLGDAVNVGTNCRIATQSAIEIGASTLIAAYCYIGPGNHQRGDDDTPLISRPMEIKGGVFIGEHAWIGTRTTILDGVRIGNGAIVGAHSLVREDVPDGAVVAGVPAKIIKPAAG